MSTARLTTNTSKEYPCTLCGSLGNIIREGTNPRVKCNSCGFVYDGSDSLAAKEAGQIPDGPPEIDIPPPKEEDDTLSNNHHADIHSNISIPNTSNNASHRIPRSPSYIIIAKDRKAFEFVTERDLKKKLLKWEASERRYDVYNMMKFEYAVSIDLKK